MMKLVDRDLIKNKTSSGASVNLFLVYLSGGFLAGFIYAVVINLLKLFNTTMHPILDFIIRLLIFFISLFITYYIVNSIALIKTDMNPSRIDYARKIKKYQVYTGEVEKIETYKKQPIRRVVLDDGTEAVSALIAKETADKMAVGESWKLGYIGMVLINVLPDDRTENIDEFDSAKPEDA